MRFTGSDAAYDHVLLGSVGLGTHRTATVTCFHQVRCMRSGQDERRGERHDVVKKSGLQHDKECGARRRAAGRLHGPAGPSEDESVSQRAPPVQCSHRHLSRHSLPVCRRHCAALL